MKFFVRGARRYAVLAVCVLALFVLPGTSLWATVHGVAARTASFVSRTVAPAFGVTSSAAAPSVTASMTGTPTVTASMTDSIENDDGDGKIDPTDGTGLTERITYSTTITNTGTADATGVQFTDTIDPHTTLVGGSLNVSPLAGDESYDTIGNTLLE